MNNRAVTDNRLPRWRSIGPVAHEHSNIFDQRRQDLLSTGRIHIRSRRREEADFLGGGRAFRLLTSAATAFTRELESAQRQAG